MIQSEGKGEAANDFELVVLEDGGVKLEW